MQHKYNHNWFFSCCYLLLLCDVDSFWCRPCVSAPLSVFLILSVSQRSGPASLSLAFVLVSVCVCAYAYSLYTIRVLYLVFALKLNAENVYVLECLSSYFDYHTIYWIYFLLNCVERRRCMARKPLFRSRFVRSSIPVTLTHWLVFHSFTTYGSIAMSLLLFCIILHRRRCMLTLYVHPIMIVCVCLFLTCLFTMYTLCMAFSIHFWFFQWSQMKNTHIFCLQIQKWIARERTQTHTQTQITRIFIQISCTFEMMKMKK